MGYVTVLVQHAWALQPNAPSQAQKQAPSSPTTKPSTPLPTTSTRLLPTDIAHLLHLHSTTTSPTDHHLYTAQLTDVLDRLHHAVLGPALSPPPPPAEPTKSTTTTPLYRPKKGMPRLASSRITLGAPSVALAPCRPSDSARRAAMRIRLCLLVFVGCAVGEWRRKAAGRLYEALDTGNELRGDAVEVEGLGGLVEGVAGVLAGWRGEGRVEEVKLVLLCLGKIVERLEYAFEESPFTFPPSVLTSLQTCLEFIDESRASYEGDHFVTVMMAMTKDSLQWLLHTNHTDSHPRTTTPQTYLKSICRGTLWKDPMRILDIPTVVLQEVREKGGTRLTRQLLEVLATAATSNDVACKCYLQCVRELKDDWMMMYYGVVLLGAVVQRHRSSAVVGVAMGEGLVAILEQDGERWADVADDEEWMRVQEGAVDALHDIWKHFPTVSLGLMALESARAVGGRLEERIRNRGPSVFKTSHLFTFRSAGFATRLLKARARSGRVLQPVKTLNRKPQSHTTQEDRPLSIAPYHRNFLASLGTSNGSLNESPKVAPSFLSSSLHPTFSLRQNQYSPAYRRKLFTPGHNPSSDL